MVAGVTSWPPDDYAESQVLRTATLAAAMERKPIRDMLLDRCGRVAIFVR